MKIAWLTPLSRTSGISRYSLAVARSLGALNDVEVDIWYPDTGDDFACPWARARALGRDGQPSLAAYDAVFYNLGNYYLNHAEIYECYLQQPGFVVLHDKVMQGFFFGYANEVLNDPLVYVRLMRYVYGAEAQRFAVDGLLQGQSTAFWEKAGAEYPLFEPCLFNATGVVTHSAETVALVDGRYPGLLPILELPLPHFIYDMDYSGKPLLTRAELELPADKVVLVAAGRFGAQKRLDITMRAIAGDPELRAKTVLIIAGGGQEEYLAYLRALAKELGIGEGVRFVVEPDDRTMHSLVKAADVAINLRYPSTESGSASLVEQLNFGSPTIVTRVGAYDEFPDELLVKIEMADEAESLRAALHRLVHDPDERARLSKAASTYAADNFSPDRYAESIVGFVESTEAQRATLAGVDAAAAEMCASEEGDWEARAERIAECMAADLAPDCDVEGEAESKPEL